MQKVITVEKARKILEDESYDGQRPIRAAHVSFLADEMTEGRFAPKTQIVFAKDESTNERWLLDGYHRLHALVQSGEPINFVITEHGVDSRASNEVARLYSRIDQGRRRSFMDTFGAFGLDEQTGMTRTSVNRMSSAITIIAADFHGSRKRIALEKRKDMVLNWLPEGKAYFGLIRNANQPQTFTQGFINAPTLAIALVTLRHEPDFALWYWRDALEDDGLRRGDPRKAMLRFFDSHKIGGGTSGHRGRQITSILWAKYVARAWNHFLADNEINRLVIRDVKNTVVPIDSTPYAVG